MKKRLIPILLAMVLLLAAMTITALADVDTTTAAYRNSISNDLKNQTYLAELSDGCTAVCPFCNAPVTWKDVATGGNVETAGHYFLSQNCNAFFSFSGATCLYLNGYDLTAAGSVVAYLPTGSTLTVMGKGTETVTGKGYNSTSSRYGAAFDLNGGSLNLCGGIYTKNNTNPGPVLAARTGAVGGEVINIYSGTTVRGGRNDTMGGNIALYATGAELNIYGGTISGGNATSGGNIAANGSSATVCNEINIYGGTITGGVASDRGGNIISYYGNVNISGGEVSNGEAYIGGNITMMRSGADLMISGSANISGGEAQHGGNIRTQEGATMTMTGGTISNGIATGATGSQGGNINANTGSIAVSGGTISGGSSADAGGNIYLNPGTTMTVSGTANITGGTANATGGGTIAMKTATLTMTGGSVTGGTGKLGAAIFMFGGSTANVSGGTITGGTATDGGSVRVQENSSFTLSGGTVTSGTATGQGGNFSVKAGCTLTISAGEVTLGNSTSQGGNIYAEEGTVNVSGGTVSRGAAANSYGGNLALYDTDLRITKGTISGGNAYVGGNIYLFGGAAANMSGGTISGGTAVDGGAVRLQGASSFTLTGGTVTGGTATSQGGNFCLKESGTALTINGGEVTQGSAKNQGGNIFANPDTTVTIGGGSITTGKSTNSYGGNIAMCGAELKTTAGTVSGGNGASGGNIFLFSGASASLSGLTLSNGTAKNGGNLYIEDDADTVTLTNCTFTGGVQSGDGGVGANLCAEAPFTATGCTFSGGSGYIRNIYHSAAVTLTNCTLNNEGGNTIRSDADLTLVNTAVNNSYMIQTAGTLTLSGNTTVYGVLPSNDVTKLHVAADFTGTADFDSLPKPTEPFYAGVMDETRYTSGGNFTGIVRLSDTQNKPQLHGKDGKLVVSAARLRKYNADETVWYLDAEAAVNAYAALADKTGYYVHLACNADVVVPAGKTAYIDFNGESPAVVTVGEGAKLYAFDSSARVGRQSNTIFNTTKLEPVFRAPNGIIYIAVPGAAEGTMVTAAAEIKLTGVSLRTRNAGIYYTATVNTHSSVSSKLTGGIALQLDNMPGADFKTTSLYTAQTGFTLDSHGADMHGVLVKNILTETNATQERADRKICAVAYLEYEGVTYLSEGASYSLTDLMDLLDDRFGSLDAAQQTQLKNFYNTYATQVGWELPAMEAFVIPENGVEV